MTLQISLRRWVSRWISRWVACRVASWVACLAVICSLSVTHQVSAQQYVVVVLDDSGSMSERLGRSGPIKMEAAKQALLSVLENLPNDSQVGVLALNTNVNAQKWIVPLGIPDEAIYTKRIRSLRPNGSTPLGAAMKTAADELLAKRGQAIYGEYRLLIVTDGEASDSSKLDQYLPDIRSRGIIVDVIGVGMPGQHSLATQVHSYRSADDKQSLEQAISEVFAETGGGAGDADEEDFDLIRGLPDQLAMDVVVALSESNNESIGSGPSGRQSEPAFPNANSPNGAASNPQPRSNTSSGLGVFGICCPLFILAMGIVLVTLINLIRKK